MTTNCEVSRFSFIAEWYQEEADITRTFIIFFYMPEHTIEIHEQNKKKIFLKRTKIPEINEKSFFVGCKIDIFGRQFNIKDYGDEFTKRALDKYRERTFILLKNSILQQLGMVLSSLEDSNFCISKGLMAQLTANQVKEFVKNHTENDEKSNLMHQLISGPSIGFELIGFDAVEKMKNSLNPLGNSSDIPKPLSVLFQRDDIRNGIYCSQSDEDFERDTNFFFANELGLQIPVKLKNSIFALIKPHVIKEGNLGKIISYITSNSFAITALRMHIMEDKFCTEFFEVFEGVYPDYKAMIKHLTSGVSMSLELVCTELYKGTFEEFHKFCGPLDPETAKIIRPHTLRAKYGSTTVLNAIHCTDLFSDTTLDLEYFFKVLK